MIKYLILITVIGFFLVKTLNWILTEFGDDA